MKVLVADKISATGVDFLRQQEGFEVVEAYGSSHEQILELARDVDAIIVRSATQVTADVIEVASSLKAVGRAGVGIDNIDVDAATAKGIVVMNTPSGNTIATAELSFTHLLCSARPIAQACASLKSGKWDKKSFAQGAELFNKTLGVLGLGRIGAAVATRALAFGMKVLAYDPYLTEERARALNVEKVDLDYLFRNADFITIHMPKTAETTHIINKDAFAIMKDGVRVINCARGGIICEADLLEALDSGKVAYAGLDVYESEPLPEDHPFRSHPRVVITPHLGASTVEAQENVGLEVAEEITAALTGRRVNNAVNMPSVDPSQLKKLMPFIDLGFKLGAFIQQFTPDEVQKLTISYQGKLADLDMMPVTRAIQRGYLMHIAEGVNDINAPHHIKRMGVEVSVVKSNQDADYSDLICVTATDAVGHDVSVQGTVIGKAQAPRLVHLDGRDVETSLDGWLLIIENEDVRGVVGAVGTILAKHDINIANMSLSRNTIGGIAINICQIDSEPSADVLKELKAQASIKEVHLLQV